MSGEVQSSTAEPAADWLINNHAGPKSPDVVSSNAESITTEFQCSNRVENSSEFNPSHPIDNSTFYHCGYACDMVLSNHAEPNDVTSSNHAEPNDTHSCDCTMPTSDPMMSPKIASNHAQKPLSEPTSDKVLSNQLVPLSAEVSTSNCAESILIRAIASNHAESASDMTLSNHSISMSAEMVSSDNTKSTPIVILSSNHASSTPSVIMCENYAEKTPSVLKSSNHAEPPPSMFQTSKHFELTPSVVSFSNHAETIPTVMQSSHCIEPTPSVLQSSDHVELSSANVSALNLTSGTIDSSKQVNITWDEEISSNHIRLESENPESLHPLRSSSLSVICSNLSETALEMVSLNQPELTGNEIIASNRTESTVSIEDLPNEILEHIFTFLDIRQRIRTELVCRQWRLVGTEMHWTYPTTLRLGFCFVQLKNCRINDNVLCSIMSRVGWTLRDFALSTYNTDLTLKSLMELGRYCPHLVSIALHIHDSQNACLKAIAERCPKLKLVQVDSLENDDYKEGIFAIVDRCKSLESFYVTNLQVTSDWLLVINPKLKILNLTSCRVLPPALLSLITRCDGLQELALKKCTSLDLNLLREALVHFKRTLVVLRMVQHPQIVEWGKMISVLTNLEALHLFGCSGVNDDLMGVLAVSCVKLRILNIGASMVTDDGLLALKGLPTLKRLNVSHAHRIVGYGLEVLAAKGVLEQVTVLSAKDVLKEACSIIAVMYPKVLFVME